MSIAYVAAFRTYTWNDSVLSLARRFFSHCPNGRHVVLADETRGSLNISDYEVISHSEDTGYLGLPRHPVGRSLWYNVDYGMYILRIRLPNYDFYLSSESDLAVNTGCEEIIRDAYTKQIDLVAHNVKPSTPDWFWHDDASQIFKSVWRSLLFFTLYSSRALDILFVTRQRHAGLFRNGAIKVWPFCEPFVPSVLKEAGLRVENVSDYVNTDYLDFRPRYMIDDPIANRAGSLVHSVVGRPEYLLELLASHHPSEYFCPLSSLSKDLTRFKKSEYELMFVDNMIARRAHGEFQYFMRLSEVGHVEKSGYYDVALLKPALISSCSKWSRFQDPRVEASGVNTTEIAEDYGFHTDEEMNPWWLVDLIDVCFIDRITLTNRPTFESRFVNLMIEVSMTSESWNTVHVKLTPEPISSDVEDPFDLRFQRPILTRFVKITMLGRDVFHLRRIQIFGSLESKEGAESG